MLEVLWIGFGLMIAKTTTGAVFDSQFNIFYIEETEDTLGMSID